MTPEFISEFLLNYNVNAAAASIIGLLVAGLYLFILALLANFVAKRFIAYVVHPVIRKTSMQWDDLLIEHKVIVRFSHIVPAAIIHFFAPALFAHTPTIASFFQLLVNIYLIVIILFVIDGVLNFTRSLWERSSMGRRYPAKSFVQAAKLVVNLIGFIFILSSILEKSPLVLFSGLGAVTAILLLIFKDAILGLVAGFQLSVNNMVMVDDWIEMPARGADGSVIDVSLTTVKVQNWDKTITTVPTYALITDSFKNWRGMSEAGGRRIKRSLHIDLRTIQFADEELLERFKRIRLLRPYLETKLEEIQKYNDGVGEELSELINGRRLTNVGTFRAYCVAYLRNHPKIHQDMTLLVRQLTPNAHGLPLEIYVFTNDIAWARYEDIQGDIFDHFLSVLPEFGLSAYQAPSGSDLEKAGLTLIKQSTDKPEAISDNTVLEPVNSASE
ncbi:mechanosensitive ion channel [Coraliomargarita sp. SDUM461004]|uniref:Mechanosensitive ion channel n=1 Tax=Thalassobacterium sedimentorum TaxID=3041258 RepID=A0ABU1AGR4_9BACT|nr:mechanosensitive ion channel domain-containing protein [Coraliomargarita sp. SDUM461004]MDQ8193882.1 mechanosensitive ion channel [Coraliomargarita sp. SDUM461004]